MAEAPRLDDLINAIRQRHPDGDPLHQLSDAVLLGDHLGELADHLIGHFVDRARHAGASWTEIGHSMGVSKQAAQKRFVPRGPTTPEESGLATFARYDTSARSALVRAQEEAHQAGHDHIAPEHVVLGLLHEPDSVAAEALHALCGSLDAVREEIAGGFGPSTGTHPLPIPFTGESKKALELTSREALRLGHSRIGAEHVLLGVLALGEGDAVAALHRLGATRDQVEAEVRRLLA
ncbi:Clp protease N-terminal domain-containing protein [Streptoalloteichus hindustanus]|uniref:Clp amino terminal domain-containing protein, pathogenicity island component n=1 Tax=Streptoalloteichus hindustanus TaxID=2017 RepID=A0A1M4XSB8_STRHI|nr:Clp protease N-terminal domain-containing protein [Streptoalloteichus hindustanus]SHE96338.1 Clp amino terminal domain-containing protein, pathogenicity island component [Streptoalloteichus hindustanus]